MGKLAENTGKAAVWLARNPFEGLGLIAAAGITKEFAASGLETMLKTSVGTALSQFTAGLGIAATALAGGMMAIDWAIDELDIGGKRKVSDDIKDTNAAAAAMRDIRIAEAAGDNATEEQLGKAFLGRATINAQAMVRRNEARRLAEETAPATGHFAVTGSGFGAVPGAPVTARDTAKLEEASRLRRQADQMEANLKIKAAQTLDTAATKFNTSADAIIKAVGKGGPRNTPMSERTN